MGGVQELNAQQLALTRRIAEHFLEPATNPVEVLEKLTYHGAVVALSGAADDERWTPEQQLIVDRYFNAVISL